jgi:hypothetical protein
MRLWIALICLALFAAAPAFAQDPAPEGGDPSGMGEEPSTLEQVTPEPEGQPEGQPELEENVPGAAVEEAITRVPTYETVGTDELGPPPIGQTPQDTFLRLAEDYIYKTEIGARLPGQVPLWPRGQFAVGPVKLFPYVNGQIGWTNNVYYDEQNTTSWFYRLGAGLTGQYDFLGGRSQLTFGGDFTYTDYLNIGSLDYPEWVLGAAFAYRFPKGFWFKVGVKWEHLVTPYGIEFNSLTKRDRVFPYIDLGMKGIGGSKVNLSAGFNMIGQDFEEREFATGNFKQYRAWISASYPVYKDQTRVYVTYAYRIRNVDSARLNDLDNSNSLTFGLKGGIPLTSSERLLGFVELGFRKDVFADPHIIEVGNDDIPTDGNDSKGIVTVGAGLRYLAGAKSVVQMRYIRDLPASMSGNYQVLDRFDLNATSNVAKDVVLRAGTFLEFSQPSTEPSMTRFGLGFGARYVVNTNADLDLAVDWDRRNTSRKGFNTTRFIGTLGLTVYFR